MRRIKVSADLAWDGLRAAKGGGALFNTQPPLPPPPPQPQHRGPRHCNAAGCGEDTAVVRSPDTSTR